VPLLSSLPPLRRFYDESRLRKRKRDKLEHALREKRDECNETKCKNIRFEERQGARKKEKSPPLSLPLLRREETRRGRSLERVGASRSESLDLLPSVDASVVRASEPVVVPEPGTRVGGAAAEVDVAAVAGNRSRYLKGNVMSLAEI